MILLTFFIFVGTSLISYFLYKQYKTKESSVVIQTQDIEEDINLKEEELRHQEALSVAYKIRAERYVSLGEIVEKLNAVVTLEEIAGYLVKEVFRLVAQSEGNVILYLLNKHKQKLEILKSYRHSSDMIIKAKEGDVFDYWVLKQAKPLLVENAKTDFRFDLERLDAELMRGIETLVASPIISKDNFLGLLRIDRSTKRAFSAEDLRLLCTISDITAVAIENALLYKKTEDFAITDSLTRLYQRKYFLERLDEELLRAKSESSTLTLIMLDIDYFKNYNDQFGHIAGDLVLKRVASVIRSAIDPERTLCCRFGGEEFLLYLINSTQEDANATAELLRKRVEEEKIILRRQNTSVTVSSGVVRYPDDATTAEDLIKLVDQRMYEAKSQGRNQTCSS